MQEVCGFPFIEQCAAKSPSTSWENLAHYFSRSLVFLLLLLIDLISRNLCLRFCVLYFTHESDSVNFRNKSRSFVQNFLHSLLLFLRLPPCPPPQPHFVSNSHTLWNSPELLRYAMQTVHFLIIWSCWQSKRKQETTAAFQELHLVKYASLW